MPPSRILQILLSAGLITLISLVGHRYRVLGGTLASMPLVLPISLTIIFLNTQGNYSQSIEFIRAAIVGLTGTGMFLLVAWWGLTKQWPIGAVVVAGYLAWIGFVALSQVVSRLLARR